MEKDFWVKTSGSRTTNTVFLVLSAIGAAGGLISGILMPVTGNANFVYPLVVFLIAGGICNLLMCVTIPKFSGLLEVPGLKLEYQPVRGKAAPKIAVNDCSLAAEKIQTGQMPDAAKEFMGKEKQDWCAKCILNGSHVLFITPKVVLIDDIVVMSRKKVHEERIFQALGDFTTTR